MEELNHTLSREDFPLAFRRYFCSLDNRTFKCDSRVMTGAEFMLRAKRYARRTGQKYRLEPNRGKGSHQRLWIGRRFTTVQRGELKPGTFRAMLKQLNINKENF